MKADKAHARPRKRREPDAEERALWREITKHDQKLRKEKTGQDSLLQASGLLAPAKAGEGNPPAFAKASVGESRIATTPLTPSAGDKRASSAHGTAPASKLKVPNPSLGEYANIDRRTADRFRKGKKPIDAMLDLHGLRRHEAHEKLLRFIRAQYTEGSRALIVVTGKGTFTGKGVLQEAVPRWLEELPEYVLAFDRAQAKDGGSGALYVLLRRKRAR